MKRILFLLLLSASMLVKAQDTISIAGSSFYLKNRSQISSVQIGYVSFDRSRRLFSVGGNGGYPIGFYFDNIVSFKIDGTTAAIAISTILDSLNARKYVASTSGAGNVQVVNFPSSQIVALDSNSQRKQLFATITNPVTSLGINNFPDSTKSRKLQDVNVVNTSLPLAVGAATSSQQTTAQNSLISMDSKSSQIMANTAYLVPTTAVFGSNAPKDTSYATNGNTISTTNLYSITIENFSTTQNATLTKGGRQIILGALGSPYPTSKTYTALCDPSSKKLSPWATLLLDALGADVYVSKTFIQ